MDQDFGDMQGNPGLFRGNTEPPLRPDLNIAEMFQSGGMASNPLAILGLQAGASFAFGQAGMMPSQFMPMQNLYDQYRSKQYWQGRMQAQQFAAAADKETYTRMLKGIARMSGTPWGIEQQRTAGVMAEDASFVAPILAQVMPEKFDAMHGIRGSATVMSQFLHSGGRFAVDPVTGQTGLSGETAGLMARGIHQQFFGTGQDLTAWRGLSAGGAGMLYDELTHRGAMGRSIGTYDSQQQVDIAAGTAEGRQAFATLLQRDHPEEFKRLRGEVEQAHKAPGSLAGLAPEEQVRKVADAENITGDAIRQLKVADSPRFDSLLQSIDFRQVAGRLKNMAGAVSAMRDIFGDMGRPNAPMAALMEELNTLTQGGIATMSPDQLEHTVRMTSNLARNTGVGMDAMKAMIGSGAATADRLGLDRQFTIGAAQGAASFGAAFGQVGRGDVAAWGRVDRDHLTVIDQQLRLQASASELANRMGATMRFVETQEQQGRPLTPELKAMSEAIRAGQGEYKDPATGAMTSLRTKRAVWLDTMARNGLARGNAAAFIQDREANQEVINRVGIGDNVRDNLQIGEAQAVLGRQFQQMSSVNLEGLIGGGDRSLEISRQVGDVLGKTMTDMPVDVRSDQAKRNKALGDAVRGVLGRAGNLTPAELAQFEKSGGPATIAETGWAANEHVMHTDPRYAIYGTLPTFLDAQNQVVSRQRAQIMAQAKSDTAMQTSMAGLGRAGPIQRVMDVIQDPPASFGAAVTEAFSGIKPEEVMRRLSGVDADKVDSKGLLAVQTEELMRTAKAHRDAVTDKTLTPEGRTASQQASQRRFNALLEGGALASTEMRTLLKAKGVHVGDGAQGLKDAIADVGRGAGSSLPKLAGDENFQRTFRSLEASIAKGIKARASEQGFAVGAQVGRREVEELLGHADLARDSARTGPGTVAAQDQAGRLFQQEQRTVDALLGDAVTIGQLGKGGFAVARRIREKQQEVEDLARAMGKTPAEALAMDPADPRVKQIRAVQAEAEAGWHDVLKRQQRPAGSPDRIMPKDELDAFEAWRKEEIRPDTAAKKSHEVLDQFLGSVGGKFRMSEPEQTQLIAMFGDGAEGRFRRGKFRGMAEARGKLEHLAGAGGINALRQRDLEGKAGPEVHSLFAAAGELGEGGPEMARTVLQKMADDKTKKDAATARDKAKPEPVKMTGVLTIRTDGRFDLVGDAQALGSTPAAPAQPNLFGV